MAPSRTPTLTTLFLLAGATGLASCEPPTMTGSFEASGAHAAKQQGVVKLSSAPAPWASAADTVDLEGDLLDYLNEARADAGLLPVRAQAQLRDAAQSHAEFLVSHRDTYASEGLSAHVQPTDLPGFVGESFVDRVGFFGYQGHAYAEVVAFKPGSVAAGRSWMESLYHRLPLLHVAMDEIGYGQASDDKGYGNVLEMGISVEPPETHQLVRWPVPDATDVPSAWDGKEIPQPPAPPQGYPSGPVITLQAYLATIEGGDATVTDTTTGAQLGRTVLVWPDDPNLPPDTLAVIPHEPLQADTTYRVSISATIDGEPVEDEWTFTTRADGCDPLAQDCGPGMGCYVIADKPRCLWAGTLTLDEPCTHTNECGSGLTCFASRCRPICDPAAPAADPMSCDGGCLHDSFPIDQAGSWSLCLPPSCAVTWGECAAGDGCYWGGTFVCAAEGQLGPGDTCGQMNDCADGLACLGLGGAFQCRTLCGGDHFPSCDTTCPDVRLPLDPDLGVYYCG